MAGWEFLNHQRPASKKLSALFIKIFYRKCKDFINCTISENQGNLEKELKKEILKKAAIYQKQRKDKNFKPYAGNSLNDD